MRQNKSIMILSIEYWNSCYKHYGRRIIWENTVGKPKEVPYLAIFSDRNTVISVVSSLRFLMIDIGLGVARYLKVTIGDDKFYVNAVKIWNFVVRALTEGLLLYLNGSADNKLDSLKRFLSTKVQELVND